MRRSGTWRRSSSGGAFGRVGAVVGTHRGTGGANDLAGGARLQDAVDRDDFEGVGPDNEARGDVVRCVLQHRPEIGIVVASAAVGQVVRPGAGQGQVDTIAFAQAGGGDLPGRRVV